MAETSARGLRDRPWWRRLLAILLLAMVAVLALNPELSFLGVFLDAAVIDVVLVAVGMQLLMYRDQIRIFAASVWHAVKRGA